MNTIGRMPKLAAALAALAINLALAGGLGSLAHHYEAQAARDLRAAGALPVTALATGQPAAVRCRPERLATG